MTPQQIKDCLEIAEMVMKANKSKEVRVIYHLVDHSLNVWSHKSDDPNMEFLINEYLYFAIYENEYKYIVDTIKEYLQSIINTLKSES